MSDSLLRTMLLASANLQRSYAVAIDEGQRSLAEGILEMQTKLNATISKAARRGVIEAKATEVLS